MSSSSSGAGGKPPIPATPSAVHRPILRERVTFAASPLRAPMHGALYLDDDLLEGEAPGLRERTNRVREAMASMIERDSARRLARLGGSDPDLDFRDAASGSA